MQLANMVVTLLKHVERPRKPTPHVSKQFVQIPTATTRTSSYKENLDLTWP